MSDSLPLSLSRRTALKTMGGAAALSAAALAAPSLARATPADLPRPDYARNMRMLGFTEMGGRADGVQVMVNKGHAFVGHIFSNGFSVVDVTDPRAPKTVNYIPAPPNTWTIHLQTIGDLLLVIHARNAFSASEFQDAVAYYSGSYTARAAEAGAQEQTWSAGMAVYDITQPAKPRQIGFMPVEGGGLHRIWYTGGRWAYASALIEGFSDFIFITIDMQDPRNPREAGRWWIPGMNLAAGETPHWSERWRYGLHHPSVSGDRAFCAWRDGGMLILDVADRRKPGLISHTNWSPPFQGGTHNCLPLPERDLIVVLDESVLPSREDGVKNIWVFDGRDLANPVSLSTVPQPDGNAEGSDYLAKGGNFGPHNLYENRPDAFVSDRLIFATMHNAGIRVYDIADRYRPQEVAALVPPRPRRQVDTRPNQALVIQNADVFVDRNQILYASDTNGGLYIMEMTV